MTALPNFFIPKPPENGKNADIHEWARDLYTFLKNNWQSGIQNPFFAQSQIDQMTNLNQAGKIFFNHTTGKAMVAEVIGGNLNIKTITTS
jgi:hypothetical protein